MYRSLTKNPPVRRQSNQPANQAAARPGRLAGLWRGLNRSLHQDLYSGLHQGSNSPVHDGTHAWDVARIRLPSDIGAPSSATTIRKVSLLSGETVTYTFCPKKGLIPHPEEEGRMLVLTNQRVIAFGLKDGLKETVLMPVEEVKAVAVSAGRRSKSTLFQGGLMVIAGVFFYVLLAYWLTGRVDGPTIPVLRMDLVAFLLFLAILSGVGMMAQIYFGKPDGEVTFQGDGVKFTFPFRGETAEDQIYQVVNATFAARQSIMGSSGLTVQ